MMGSWRGVVTVAVGLVALVHCSDSESTGANGTGGAGGGAASGGVGGAGAAGGGGPVTCDDPVDVGPLVDRVPPGGWRDVAWEDPYPGQWETVDVSDHGVQPGAGDVSAALQVIIDGLTVPTVLEIPAGTYELHSTVTMVSDLILSGAGPEETVFELVGGLTGAFSWAGEGGQWSWSWIEEEYQPRAVTAAVAADETVIMIESTAGLAAGDIVVVAETLDNPSFPSAALSKGGIFELTEVTADSVTVDLPLAIGLRVQNDAGEPTVVAKLRPMVNGGIENVGFSSPTLTSYDDAIVAVYQVDNVFIRNLFSTNSFGADVRVSNSRRVSLLDCFFDGTQGNAPDGGESIWIDQLNTRVMVANNILREKHPPLMVQVGGNFVVYAYNFHVDRLADYCHETDDPNCRELDWIRDPEVNGIARGWHGLADVVFHGNYPHHYLIEGNVFYNAIFDYHHFENGPGTTIYRNRILGSPDDLTWWMNSYGTWIDGPHDSQNLVGNLYLNDSFITLDLHNGPTEAQDVFMAANRLSGAVDWGELPDDTTLSPSLYRSCPPPFWRDDLPWPPYGPEVDDAATNRIPAQIRYEQLVADGH